MRSAVSYKYLKITYFDHAMSLRLKADFVVVGLVLVT